MENETDCYGKMNDVVLILSTQERSWDSKNMGPAQARADIREVFNTL